MWILNYMLIHQSKIQIWEDWKCYRTHTCKDRCLLQIRLLNVSLIPGFHISYFSWIYLLLSEGKNTKERYSYGQKIMHAGIWNVHFMFQSFRNFNINPSPPPPPLKANLGHLPITESCTASLSLRTADVSFRSSPSLSGDKLGETSAIRRLSLSEWGIWPVLGLGVEFEPHVTS